MATPPKSEIEKLPAEMKQAMLSSLPDLKSLNSTLSSCSAFYEAFRDSKSVITNQVILNELGSDMLAEAKIVSELSKIKPQTKEQIKELCTQYLASRVSPTMFWAPGVFIPGEASSVSKVHSAINYFKYDFVATAMKNMPEGGRSSPPSKEELRRIERAFYRFEMYCCLFRDCDRNDNYRVTLKEREELFFSKFTPWENEQLACVHEYFFRLALPAFNEMAEHDVYWGFMHIPRADFDYTEFIEGILAKGLCFIHKLSLATTYEDRRKLLGQERPTYTYPNLDSALSEPHCFLEDDVLGDGADLKTLGIGEPFYADPDSGPVDVWRWAHLDNPPDLFVNIKELRPFRMWGYVFWDLIRIDNTNVMQNELDWPFDLGQSYLRDIELEREQWELSREWSESVDRRTVIYQNGGEGWFALENESKVIYRGNNSTTGRRR